MHKSSLLIAPLLAVGVFSGSWGIAHFVEASTTQQTQASVSGSASKVKLAAVERADQNVSAQLANTHAVQLRITKKNGTWMLQDAASGRVTVAVPLNTSIHVLMDDNLNETIQSVRIVPLHERPNRASEEQRLENMIHRLDPKGAAIMSTELGKYTCFVQLQGVSQPIVFQYAVTPAVSRPQIHVS